MILVAIELNRRGDRLKEKTTTFTSNGLLRRNDPAIGGRKVQPYHVGILREGHDHGPANQAGLASALIYRRHAQKGFGATHPPDIRGVQDLMFFVSRFAKFPDHVKGLVNLLEAAHGRGAAVPD